MMPPIACEKLRSSRDKFPSRVLIVDDEPLVCWSLATGLRQAGFYTDTASTAAEALILAGVAPHPDAVLLDARLHECNPAVLLRQLRVAAPDCRFLLMTTERHETPGPSYEAVIIRKPFDLTDVIRLVDAAVSRA
jgi:two-component system nitrogen regulation response regulator GlnG